MATKDCEINVNNEKIDINVKYSEPELFSENDPLQEKQEEKKKRKSVKRQIQEGFSNITVEPVLAGSIIPSVLSKLAVYNLNLDKACRVNKGFGDTICDALIDKTSINYTVQEAEIQKLIGSMDAWKSIIMTSIPSLLVLFLGAWSDRTGKRKFCILLPVVGNILVCLSNILNVYFFYEIPVQITMILEAIFPAFTGGTVTLLLGVFSYISDVTPKESRTFRVGIVNLCMTAGVPLGTALSGVMLNWIGYYGVFSVALLIYICVFIYGLFYLQEPNVRNRIESSEIKKNNTSNVSFFDLTHLKDNLKVVLKIRPGNGRLKIILCLLIVSIVYGPMQGEGMVQYLFVRFRLHWDAVEYSKYGTVHILLHSIGALFSITVFSRYLGLDDSILGLISVISKFFGSINIAFVVNNIHMYFVPVIEILNATMFTSLRSMASKLVESEEMGKINSIISLVEALTALVYDPIYSWLYVLRIPDMPGAVFLLSAVLTLPAAGLLILFYLDSRHEKNLESTENYLNAKIEIVKENLAKSI